MCTEKKAAPCQHLTFAHVGRSGCCNECSDYFFLHISACPFAFDTVRRVCDYVIGVRGPQVAVGFVYELVSSFAYFPFRITCTRVLLSPRAPWAALRRIGFDTQSSIAPISHFFSDCYEKWHERGFLLRFALRKIGGRNFCEETRRSHSLGYI